MAKNSILAVSLVFCLAPLALAQDLLLTNAQIIDPASQAVRQGHLLLRDGVIAATPDQIPADFSGQTIDLEGQWVIPGLNDLHTHSYGNMGPGNAFDVVGISGVAQRMLYAGVTGFMDLFGLKNSCMPCAMPGRWVPRR